MGRPLVSVLMITYNHEDYIRQAIESVLMQETDFDVELVIGEDCSTDATRSIAMEYAEQHPDRVQLVLAYSNQGWHRNFNDTLAQCRGQYIALLEGDDYWLSPNKLQMQVDFLRTHPDCAMCFTRVQKFYDDASAPSTTLPGFAVKEISDIKDIIERQFAQTCSVIFRRDSFDGMPAWFKDLKLGDWPMWILIAQRGKLGFIDELTAAYRMHAGGVWSGKDPVFMCKEIIKMFTHLLEHIEPQYRSLVRAAISREYFELSWLLRNEGKSHQAKKAIASCVRMKPLNPQLSKKRVAMMWMRYHATPLYKAANVIGKPFLG